MNTFLIQSLLAMAMLLTACGTIVNGPTESVPVSTEPEGATVTIGGTTKQTPATFDLDRKQDYLLTITKSGYQTENIKIQHVISGAEAGNLLGFGSLGVAIDAASGALWKLEPENIDITLTPLHSDKVRTLAQRLNVETLEKSLDELKTMKEEGLIDEQQYTAIRNITIHTVHPQGVVLA
jgi:hypothetical protein